MSNNSAQSDFKKLQIVYQELMAQIRVWEDKLQNKQANSTKRREQAIERKLKMTEKLRTTETTISELKSVLEAQEGEITQIHSKKEESLSKTAQKKIDSLNSQMEELNQQIIDIENQIAKAKEETQTLEKENNDLQREITEAKNTTVSEEDVDLKSLNEEFLRLKKEIEALDCDIKDKNYNIRELENHKALLQTKSKEKQRKIDEIQFFANKILFFEYAKKSGHSWEDKALEYYFEANSLWKIAKDAYAERKPKKFIVNGYRAFKKAVTAFYVALRENPVLEDQELRYQFENLSLSYRIPIRWRGMDEIERLAERIQNGVDVLPERRFLEQVYTLLNKNMGLLRVKGVQSSVSALSAEQPKAKKCFFCGKELADVERECPQCGFEPPRCLISDTAIFFGDFTKRCPMCNGRFHSEHLLKWLSTKSESKCPNCGKKVSGDQFITE
ncbi:MAG: hypothetical protein ACFFCZ_00775 [Promethearchaeota archaeon]